MTALDKAIGQGDLPQVEALLQAGTAPDERDRGGRTVLMYAALNGKDAVLRLLIAAGADVNAQDKNGDTALHFAAQDYRPSSVRLLCESGARLEAVDRFGNTPLWRAVMHGRGRGEVIELLIQYGANRDEGNLCGNSPRDAGDMISNYDMKPFLR